jgi:hypothetical protein
MKRAAPGTQLDSFAGHPIPDPGETASEILARAVALFVEGLNAAAREAFERANTPDETIDCARARDLTGRTTQTISAWCEQGFIEGAYRKGPRGRWRFKHSALKACLLRGGRRRRRQSAP